MANHIRQAWFPESRTDHFPRFNDINSLGNEVARLPLQLEQELHLQLILKYLEVSFSYMIEFNCCS